MSNPERSEALTLSHLTTKQIRARLIALMDYEMSIYRSREDNEYVDKALHNIMIQKDRYNTILRDRSSQAHGFVATDEHDHCE